jgi:tight adherence protein C
VVPVSAPIAWAVLCGVVLGVGLWSLVSLTPRLMKPRLRDRVAPYVLDISAEARAYMNRRPVDPVPVLGTIFAPLLERLTELLLRCWAAPSNRTATSSIRVRVDTEEISITAGRVDGDGLCTGSEPGHRNPHRQAGAVPGQLALPVVLGVGAALGRDWLLQRAARRRLGRMSSELPTVLNSSRCLSQRGKASSIPSGVCPRPVPANCRGSSPAWSPTCALGSL